MILCNLPVLLAERRLKVADLIRMTGISKSTMHKIYNEQTTRIDFETMDKICEALDIDVGDLYTYVPNEEQKKSSHD
ncbi:helix-turn-helix transcriptional regulator [Psychrobacter arenosus]|uniref:helix-turn-helix domain-containing protein n=1 Tax=Psychrobacter arenosus TaxID=256326 RepID=UPI0019192A79|nr:helix-turn-helix transcriptional regulator [Psychrobacter arenosus]